jgi:capsular exopolysaccharide synthesis family protein
MRTIPDVRVLDVARVPNRPLTHLAPAIMLLGVITGAGTGVGVAVARQVLDRKVRLPTEVASHLGMRILGVIPHVSQKIHESEPAAVVEALRVIRLNVLNAHGTAGPVVFTITSAGGGEGKSFIACNLALSFAAMGQPTLLIDADTRRGRLHRTLGAVRKPGLIDHLSGRLSAEDVVQITRFPNLHFVGCGSRSRAGPELLMTPAPARLLSHVRANYDVIIVDSPPLAAGVDPYALAGLTGNVLLVVRTNVTDRQLASAKLEVLTHLPVRILGAVLNDARMTGAYEYYAYSIAGYEAQDEEEVRGTHAPQILRD